MTMHIVQALPPNFAAINAAFNVAGQAVYFCYGDKIYNPAGKFISEAMIKHETVHSIRQASTTPERWWEQYIEDKAFRLAEEVAAHRAEYQWHRQHPHVAPKGWGSSDRFHLAMIAKRLSSPLYGTMVTLTRAKQLIAE